MLQAVLQQSDSVTDRLREENDILKAQVGNWKLPQHSWNNIYQKLTVFITSPFPISSLLPFLLSLILNPSLIIWSWWNTKANYWYNDLHEVISGHILMNSIVHLSGHLWQKFDIRVFLTHQLNKIFESLYDESLLLVLPIHTGFSNLNPFLTHVSLCNACVSGREGVRKVICLCYVCCLFFFFLSAFLHRRG